MTTLVPCLRRRSDDTPLPAVLIFTSHCRSSHPSADTRSLCFCLLFFLFSTHTSSGGDTALGASLMLTLSRWTGAKGRAKSLSSGLELLTRHRRSGTGVADNTDDCFRLFHLSVAGRLWASMHKTRTLKPKQPELTRYFLLGFYSNGDMSKSRRKKNDDVFLLCRSQPFTWQNADRRAVLAWGLMLSESGNMAEVTLLHSALELTAFNQLIGLAARGFEMKDAYNRKN